MRFFRNICIFRLITALLLLLSQAALSFAYEVVAVKSDDIKPYSDALKGFKATCGCSIKELEIVSDNLLREIHRINPDAVLAIGMDALRHLRSIDNIPLVYTMIPYTPPSLMQDNISGVSMEISPQTYINSIMEIFPSAYRAGLIYSRKTESFSMEAVQIANSKGIKMIAKSAHSPTEVPSIIDSMQGKIDVFWMLPDTTVVTPEIIDYLLLFSFKNKFPVITFSKKYVEMGAVVSLSIDPFDMGSQAGEVARSLVNQSKKAPIRENPRKTVLTINKKVATKLGIKIKDEILRKADVIN